MMIVNEKEESPKWALFSTIDDEFRDWLLAQGKTRWTIREIIILPKDSATYQTQVTPLLY